MDTGLRPGSNPLAAVSKLRQFRSLHVYPCSFSGIDECLAIGSYRIKNNFRGAIAAWLDASMKLTCWASSDVVHCLAILAKAPNFYLAKYKLP